MRIRIFLLTILIFGAIFLACEATIVYKSPADLPLIAYQPTDYQLPIPPGVPKPQLPEDNPLTEEGIALGARLFHDPMLSADSTMSCASCHLADLSMTDGKAVSRGIGGQQGRRSAMPLVNLAFNKEGFFWDGRVMTLEEQALLPVEDTIELHNTWDRVVEQLRKHPTYPPAFRKAFGIKNVSEIDKFLAVKAIAQYERTLISANSRYDSVEMGLTTFTEDEQAGHDIFFDERETLPDAECGHCHNIPLMTTNEFLNNGIEKAATTADFSDKGRGAVTGSPFDNGKFRVPSLRNVELTAPYMHDGRFATLEEVIEHYNSGGHQSPTISPLIRPLNLDEIQKRQLIAFLMTLTDLKFVENVQQREELMY